jgi:hypothetical protein
VNKDSVEFGFLVGAVACFDSRSFSSIFRAQGGSPAVAVHSHEDTFAAFFANGDIATPAASLLSSGRVVTCGVCDPIGGAYMIPAAPSATSPPMTSRTGRWSRAPPRHARVASRSSEGRLWRHTRNLRAAASTKSSGNYRGGRRSCYPSQLTSPPASPK